MKLGELIKKNDLKSVSVAIDENDIESRVVFENIEMIPMKYWDADIKTFRHKINQDGNKINSIELIVIIKR